MYVCMYVCECVLSGEAKAIWREEKGEKQQNARVARRVFIRV